MSTKPNSDKPSFSVRFKKFYNTYGLKYLLYAFFATVIIFIVALGVLEVMKQNKKVAIPVVSTKNEPYICFEGLDWGMSVNDCFAALGADQTEFEIYYAESPCGFQSSAYAGKTKLFGKLSDLTLWFTSYGNGSSPGLSSIVIANLYTKGDKILPKMEKMFADTNCEMNSSSINHPEKDPPYITKQVEWTKGKFDEITEMDFKKAWEEYVEKSSGKKKNALTSQYLSICKMQYLEDETHLRIDIRGEPAAYYNYLKKQLSN